MRLLNAAGETPSGKVAACPGMSCSQFASRMSKGGKGKWRKRAEEAVAGCDRCDGNPPEHKADEGNDEVEELVEEIGAMIFFAEGGGATDWNEYPIEYYQLFCWWRAAEREIEESRAAKLSAFISGFSKA